MHLYHLWKASGMRDFTWFFFLTACMYLLSTYAEQGSSVHFTAERNPNVRAVASEQKMDGPAIPENISNIHF